MSTPIDDVAPSSSSAIETGADPLGDGDRRRVERTLETAGSIRRIWRVIRICGWLAAASMLLLGIVGAVAWIAQVVTS